MATVITSMALTGIDGIAVSVDVDLPLKSDLTLLE